MSAATVEIPVRFLTDADCADCATRLEEALMQHRGIAGVKATAPDRLNVAYDPELCNLECLTEAATKIGIELGRTFSHENLAVAGMDCYDCAQTIESAAKRVEGVIHCRVNFPAARMSLEYDTSNSESAAKVEKIVSQLGYRLIRPELRAPGESTAGQAEQDLREPEPWLRRRRDELITASAAIGTIAAIILDAATASRTPALVLYSLAIALGGSRIAVTGFRAVVTSRRLDINVLMTIAVVGAVAIDAWLEAALVVVLFRIGENLEHYAVDRARRSLESLMSLAPGVAHRRTLTESGQEAIEDVAASELLLNDQVRVRPGESFPSDGSIVDGQSSVNQAPITGESLPVEKGVGSEVYAGTINGEGALVVRVTNAPGDSTLDRVARAVAQAQAQRSPAERWVNSFARIYTPLVLVTAALVAIGPPVLLGQEWSPWIYRGLAFLILACPCALVIATPVAVVAALSRASQAGVLVKGGVHLEAATRLKVVATDKTGTLTLGKPKVVDIEPVGAHSADDVLSLAASVDSSSEHPLARAIVDAAGRSGLAIPQAEDFESIRGYGARAVVNGLRITVGNSRMISDHPAFNEAEEAIGRITQGGTAVVVATDDQIIGVLGIADTIRPDAAAAISDWKRMGISHAVLLTGDNLGAAEAIAIAAGITEVRANLLPDGKVSELDRVQQQFGPTAMIGDGVNDSPALAKSTLGIAMGGAGSPAAIETADVVLMGDDLRKIGGFLALAKASQGIVRQNIAFSLGTKAIAAVFALAGLLPLWLAVLTDVGATLLVVANGLRLLRIRLDPPIDFKGALSPKDQTDVSALTPGSTLEH